MNQINEMWSRDAVLGASGDDVARMVSDVKGRITRHDRNASELARAAAYTTAAYFKANPDATVGKVAKDWNANRTTLYKWKRTGVAIVFGGVDEGTDAFAAMGQVVNRAPLASVLDGKGRDGKGENLTVTPDDVTWALGVLYPKGFRDDDNNMRQPLKQADVENILTPKSEAEVKAEAQAALVKDVESALKALTRAIPLIEDDKVIADTFDAFGPLARALNTRVAKVKDADAAARITDARNKTAPKNTAKKAAAKAA